MLLLCQIILTCGFSILIALGDPLDILADNIEFQIHPIPHFKLMEICIFICIGNNGYRKRAFL